MCETHRGYPEWVLNRTKNIVKHKKSSNLLHPTYIDNLSNQQPTLVLEYKNQFSAIKIIVDKYIPMLMEDETMDEILSGGYRVLYKNPIFPSEMGFEPTQEDLMTPSPILTNFAWASVRSDHQR